MADGSDELEEGLEEKKPSFCFLLKTWTIYYITLSFALLAIFRFKQFYFFVLSYEIASLKKKKLVFDFFFNFNKS